MEITTAFQIWATLASNKLDVERLDDKNTKIYFNKYKDILRYTKDITEAIR